VYGYQGQVDSDPMLQRGLSSDRESWEDSQQVVPPIERCCSILIDEMIGSISQPLPPQGQPMYIRVMEAAAAADRFHTMEEGKFCNTSPLSTVFHDRPSKNQPQKDQVGRYLQRLFFCFCCVACNTPLIRRPVQEQSSYIRAIEATAAAVAERLAQPSQVNMSSKDMGMNAGVAGASGRDAAPATGQRLATRELQQERHPAPKVNGHNCASVHQVCAPPQSTSLMPQHQVLLKVVAISLYEQETYLVRTSCCKHKHNCLQDLWFARV
jgi:hypothetical protein